MRTAAAPQCLPGFVVGLCFAGLAGLGNAAGSVEVRPQTTASNIPLDNKAAEVSRLQGELLARQAAGYLGEWLSSRVDRFDVAPDPATVPALDLPPGTMDIRVRPLPDDARPVSRMPLWLDLFIDGRFERSVLVTSRVRAYCAAWMANTDLAAGTRLAPQFLTHSELDVAAMGITPWRGDPTGAVLRTRVLRGSALTARNVAPALAVSRGERVLLSSRVGGIEVLAAAQALQDADVGQRVQVRVDAAQGPVLATVREPGLLEIIR